MCDNEFCTTNITVASCISCLHPCDVYESIMLGFGDDCVFCVFGKMPVLLLIDVDVVVDTERGEADVNEKTDISSSSRLRLFGCGIFFASAACMRAEYSGCCAW